MTDYQKRAAQLPVRNSEFLWALLIDMARTVDLLVAQSKPDTDEEALDADARH